MIRLFSYTQHPVYLYWVGRVISLDLTLFSSALFKTIRLIAALGVTLQ